MKIFLVGSVADNTPWLQRWKLILEEKHRRDRWEIDNSLQYPAEKSSNGCPRQGVLLQGGVRFLQGKRRCWRWCWQFLPCFSANTAYFSSAPAQTSCCLLLLVMLSALSVVYQLFSLWAYEILDSIFQVFQWLIFFVVLYIWFNIN